MTEQQYHVDRITLVPQDAAVVSGSVEHDGIGPFLAEALTEVVAVLDAQGVGLDGPAFARYHLTDDGWDVQAGFPTRAPVEAAGRVEPIVLPGGTALAVLHRGPYAEVGAAYRAAEAWLRENGWAPTAEPWEVYLDEVDTAAPRTVVQWPARPS